MIRSLMKSYLHKPIKILQFRSHGKIQKMFNTTLFQNFQPASHLKAESRI